MPIPALKDNYIWLLINPANLHCAVVDPGDADPVLSVLKEQGLTLSAVLITHHHWDHTAGLAKLREHFTFDTYGPAHESVPGVDHKLSEDDLIDIKPLGLQFSVLDIPGHTKGHIAYVGHGMLFCGDTMFSAGCGRLFEGTADQMVVSLAKMTSLPEDTLLYCAHEYTAVNLRFAQTIEPYNNDILTRINDVAALRENNKPTLPSVLRIEKATNPFLRCHVNSVIESVQQKVKKQLTDPVSIFQALRAWKDTF